MKWTAVIAAAGEGKRLGFDGPKVLCPVNGKTILARLYEVLRPFCGDFVIVSSVSACLRIDTAMRALVSSETIFIIPSQFPVDGTAKAVALGLADVETSGVIIVWGDTVITDDTMIVRGIRTIEQGCDLAVPTAYVENPYVSLEIIEGRIDGVDYAREGAAMPEWGSTDMGVFFARTSVLEGALREWFLNGEVGRQSGEWNFPDVLPLIESQICLSVAETASMGVNTQVELAKVEETLRQCKISL